MATLPALVSALAPVDGRERKSIDHVARVIREAGYMPTAGRGGAAAEMDASAAVNLLLGLNCADAPKDAPSAVGLMRKLEPMVHKTSGDLPEVFRAAEAADFGEALETLIKGLPEVLDSVRVDLRTAFASEDQPLAGDLHFQNTVRGRGLVQTRISLMYGFAEVALERSGSRGEQMADWNVKYFIPADDLEAYSKIFKIDADRRVTVTIGIPTLLAVWKCLFGDGRDVELAANG